MDNRNGTMKLIGEKLVDYGISGEVSFDARTEEYCVDVDGDWKHEHLACDSVLRRELGLIPTAETILDEAEGDCYRSEHRYREE